MSLFLKLSPHCKECAWRQRARAESANRPLAGVVLGVREGLSLPLIACRPPPEGSLLIEHTLAHLLKKHCGFDLSKFSFCPYSVLHPGRGFSQIELYITHF
jgi:hypothetical protein